MVPKGNRRLFAHARANELGFVWVDRHVDIGVERASGRIRPFARPDVEAPLQLVGRDAPDAPDATAFVVAVVVDAMLPDVGLFESALAFLQVVRAREDEGPNEIPSAAGDSSLAEVEVE